MTEIGDYNLIMSDRNIFNQIVYTPLPEAIRILEERRKDPILVAKVEKLLNGHVPEIFKKTKCAIMARQLATPNHENRRFITLAEESNLQPIFFEYFGDKFTSNNKYKHSLGQLHIQNGINKNGESIVENVTIVDFNKYNGKKLEEVKTIWGESLIDFHKKLFSLYNVNSEGLFFNENDWYEKNINEKPEDFYLKFFLLNTCFGIIFENFLTLKNSEGDFTKNIVLPTIEKVMNLVGVKPLIVTVEATNLELDDFWYYHLPIIKKFIK